jgi:hypothetical protein
MGKAAKGNAQRRNKNGAMALDGEHGTMRKRARQRHEKGEISNERSEMSKCNEYTGQEATGKEHGTSGKGQLTRRKKQRSQRQKRKKDIQ